MERFCKFLLAVLSVFATGLMYGLSIPMILVILVVIFDIGVDALMVLCFIAPVYLLYEFNEWLKKKC
jgi:hypothetical protein